MSVEDLYGYDGIFLVQITKVSGNRMTALKRKDVAKIAAHRLSNSSSGACKRKIESLEDLVRNHQKSCGIEARQFFYQSKMF